VNVYSKKQRYINTQESLIRTQESLKTLKEFMDKKDETANKLSDVWCRPYAQKM
jgi:hypothetical protein